MTHDPSPNPNKPNIMKTTIKDNVLHIEIPLHTPRPSASGKTLTVASTNGNQPTEVKINGLPVIVGLNAYIKPEK
jgi:hypothetical protein